MGIGDGDSNHSDAPYVFSSKPDYGKRIEPLIEYYQDQDGVKTQIEYYMAELPAIATRLGNSEKVLKGVLKFLKEYSERQIISPPLYPRHLAAAYRNVTQKENERRTEKAIAEAFEISPKTLIKGIHDLEGILELHAGIGSAAYKRLLKV